MDSYSLPIYQEESMTGWFDQTMPRFITSPPLIATIVIIRYTTTSMFEAFRKLFGNSAVPLAEEQDLGFILSMLLCNRPKLKGCVPNSDVLSTYSNSDLFLRSNLSNDTRIIRWCLPHIVLLLHYSRCPYGFFSCLIPLNILSVTLTSRHNLLLLHTLISFPVKPLSCMIQVELSSRIYHLSLWTLNVFVRLWWLRTDESYSNARHTSSKCPTCTVLSYRVPLIFVISAISTNAAPYVSGKPLISVVSLFVHISFVSYVWLYDLHLCELYFLLSSF